jgi:hypothetical protein
VGSLVVTAMADVLHKCINADCICGSIEKIVEFKQTNKSMFPLVKIRHFAHHSSDEQRLYCKEQRLSKMVLIAQPTAVI